MQCYENYLVFNLETPAVTRQEAKEILHTATSHYGRRKFVFISNRALPTVVAKDAYKEVDSRYLTGIAIVSPDVDAREMAVGEQMLYDGSFSYFTSLDEAIDWAQTVVKRST